MENQVSRFHKRQSLFIFLAFFILLTVLIIVTGRHYLDAQKYEREILAREFQERIIYLDHLLSSVTDNVNRMRTLAEADLMQSRYSQTLNEPIEFSYLKDAPNQTYYTLDNFDFPIKKEMIGNLTGLGSLEYRNDDFYKEIYMALNLNPLFRTISESLENVAWVYYTSKNNFLNIYPWVSSADFRFSKELLSHEFYKLGVPEQNPGRDSFWTQVYVDEYGKGLMTTCAAPVYDNDRFLGTVAVDLTVDFLNTIVKRFTISRGVMCLINDRGQLLAHPSAISSKDKKAKMLDEILPVELKSLSTPVTRLPDEKHIQKNSYLIYSDHLHQAPWQVLYYEKERSFPASLIDLLGPEPPIVLGMLLILVVMVFYITEKQFISPSKNFVNHIINRSQQRDSTVYKESGIPEVWKKWFEIIDSVFSDNENLTQRIVKHNEILELEVKQRTSELVKEIEERKTTEMEKERLIAELKSTLSEVKTLQGLIPICARCKKIRDDQGFWENMESYIEKNTDALFSHGICLDCSEELYSDQDWYIKSKKKNE